MRKITPERLAEIEADAMLRPPVREGWGPHEMRVNTDELAKRSFLNVFRGYEHWLSLSGFINSDRSSRLLSGPVRMCTSYSISMEERQTRIAESRTTGHIPIS
jgi:hypothetical protein